MAHDRKLSAIFVLMVMLLAMLPGQRLARAGWLVLSDARTSDASAVPEGLTKALAAIPDPSAIHCVTLGDDNGYVIISKKNGFSASGIPQDAFDKLKELADKGEELRSIALAPGGGWVILYGQTGFAAAGVPDELLQDLGTQEKQKNQVTQVSFTPNGGWAMLMGDNTSKCRNVPDAAFQKLGELQKKNVTIKSITFTSKSGWVILYNKSDHAEGNIDKDLAQKLADLTKQGATINQVVVTSDFLDMRKNDAATRKAVEALMAQYKVPGMSVAVVDGGKLAWARGYGVQEAGGDLPVNEFTHFQAASVSKFITSLGVMHLVELGTLKLDTPFNNTLTSWKIPENSFTRQKPVTLRMIMSHTAGFTVHGFDGYESSTAKLPDLTQILNGTRPANSPAIVVDQLPGSAFRYSGGGITVMEQGMIDATHKPFPALMKEMVLDPLDMKLSTYDILLPQNANALFATAHIDGKPMKGKWHLYPESAAAGLWTTPTDLTKVIIALQDAWMAKDPHQPISHDLASQMLKQQSPGPWGLGVEITGSGKTLCFKHDGVNAGFQSQVIGFAETGQGVVIMVNGDKSEGLISEVVRDLRIAYHWPPS